MKLTIKEEKIARLALDKGAKDGERQAAAIKLIESLYARGVQVEEIEAEIIPEKKAPKPTPAPVYQNVPVYKTTKPAEPVPKRDYWGEFLTNLRITVLIAIFAPAVIYIALMITVNCPSLAALIGISVTVWLIRKWTIVLKS